MNGVNTLNDAQEEQIKLKYTMNKFCSSAWPEKKKKKKIDELRGRQMLMNTFKSEIFPTHSRNMSSTSKSEFDRTLKSEPSSNFFSN